MAHKGSKPYKSGTGGHKKPAKSTPKSGKKK